MYIVSPLKSLSSSIDVAPDSGARDPAARDDFAGQADVEGCERAGEGHQGGRQRSAAEGYAVRSPSTSGQSMPFRTFSPSSHFALIPSSHKL